MAYDGTLYCSKLRKARGREEFKEIRTIAYITFEVGPG